MRRATTLVAGMPLVVLAALAGARADGPAALKPRHAVLVILGGGVRAKEMLDPSVMPAVAALAADGCVVDGIESGSSTPYEAATRLLTGRSDAPDPATRPRPRVPTILERARRALSLPAEKVWFVSHAGGDELHLVPSEDPDHGAAAAPSIAFGDGAFGEPLHDLLEAWGHPVATEDSTWGLLRGLRLQNRAAVETWLPQGVDAGLAEAERVERALLQELDRRTLLSRSPAPDDERALRAAVTVLRVHRPVLTVIRLGGGVYAEAGVDRSLDVLRADDRGLAALRAAVDADDTMRGATAVFVVADLGRGDGKERTAAVLVGAGPGVKKGGKVKGERRLTDVAPTLARLLGFDMPQADGTVWTGVLN